MLVAVSMSAAEIMVTEVIAKLKEVGLSVGAQKTHWTSCPKIMDKRIMVDGSGCVVGGSSGVCGNKWCVQMGRQDMQLHTDLLKPTNVWRSGDQF